MKVKVKRLFEPEPGTEAGAGHDGEELVLLRYRDLETILNRALATSKRVQPLLSIREIRTWLGYKTNLPIERMIEEGVFPPPIWIGTERRWERRVVEQWLTSPERRSRKGEMRN